MTSVDSGVETGNDSNDSAQTDTQFNNPGLIKTATSTAMDMQLLPLGTREWDGAKINTRLSSTPTIISRPERSDVTEHSFLCANVSRLVWANTSLDTFAHRNECSVTSLPESTLSATLPNIHNNEAIQSFEFFNLESGSTQVRKVSNIIFHDPIYDVKKTIVFTAYTIQDTTAIHDSSEIDKKK